MESLHVIQNEKNLGFIRTVNKGMQISSNNIVLLNTDTEVPPMWLSRLAMQIVHNENISSVTPFSNSATICSFPNFCENNDLYKNLDCTTLDQYFKKYGGNDVVEIPTGVGFCMAMSRKVINQIGYFDAETYGKGYCEENDWCMRAKSAGFKNVMVPNLFVFHKHGVSFAEQKNKSKDTRIQENLLKLNGRYPKYDALIQKFISTDVLKVRRLFLKMIIDANESDLPGTLYFNHAMGGGATAYLNKKISEGKLKERSYVLEIQADMQTATLKDYAKATPIFLNFKEISSEEFNYLLNSLQVSKIFVNQLVSYPVKKAIDLIMNSECEYIFFIHDYFVICPRYTLLLNSGKTCVNRICGGEWKKSCSVCKDIDIDFMEWHTMFSEFLQHAKTIIAPSVATKNIVNSVYPDVDIMVQKHIILHKLSKTFKKDFFTQRPLIIGVIGALGKQKGSKIVCELANKIRKEKLPIKIKIIGYTDLHIKPYCSNDGILEITGRYDNKAISSLLEKYQVGIVLIPSIWPETFSYTTEEALQSGYPVMTFNLGAPAERVNETNGWLIDEISVDAVLKKIKEILKEDKCGNLM
jgi:GT2 family glycosyltransferase